MLSSLTRTVRRGLLIKTSKSPRIGLADLPVEAILCICQHLCPHCLGLPFLQKPTLDEKKFLQGLKAFSQTAQRYRALARPVLFHRPRFGSNPSSGFIQECIQNHDIASHAKELHGLVNYYNISKIITHDLRWYFRYLLFQTRLSRSQPEPFTWDPIENQFELVMASARLNLITTPNLEVLSLTSGFGDIPSPWNKDRQLLEQIDGSDQARNPGLKRLRALRLCPNLHYFEFRHAYSLMQLVIAQQPPLAEVTFVGSIHFNEQISSYQLDIPGRFPQGIKCLRFFSAKFDLNGWSYKFPPFWMIRLISRLEKFVFKTLRDRHGQGRYYISPKELTGELRRHKDSLTYLDLDIHYNSVLLRPSRYPQTLIIPIQIAAFCNLKTLKLHETTFCRHWCKGIPGFQGPTASSCLINLIGPNIRHFTITVADRSRVTPDVINLAAPASNGTYRSLKTLEIVYERYRDGREHLLWYQLASSRRAIKKAFHATPIQIVFTKLDDPLAESYEAMPPPMGPQPITEEAVKALYKTGRNCLLHHEESQEGAYEERPEARTV